MPNRGSVNRRTGKTTPRNKKKSHWGAKKSSGRSTKAKPAAKAKAKAKA